MSTTAVPSTKAEAFSFHAECGVGVGVGAQPAALFEHLDDPRRLGGHMEKPSWRTLGSSMRYAFDAANGKALGSEIRMEGQLFGFGLCLTEVVTAHQPPRRKVWSTVGVPRLVVIGPYRMGFEIAPAASGCTLRVFIDYELGPLRPRWLCAPLAAWYARWCVQSMAQDARRRFS